MGNRHLTDQQRLLVDMAREGFANRQETSAIVSLGAGAGTWAVKVKSHVAYNIYSVRRLIVEDAGLPPMEVGEQMEAFNLAESFLSPGTLAAGTCAIMHRVGEKYVFHVAP